MDEERPDYHPRKTTFEKYYKVARSFCLSQLVPLPRARLRVESNGTEVEIMATATQFLDLTKQVLANGHLTTRDRAIVLIQLQSGQDASTLVKVFNYVAYPQLVEHFGTEDYRKWGPEKCPVRIDLIRPKSDYRYYSYVDIDALECLRAWLAVRRRKFQRHIQVHTSRPGMLPRSDPIFVRYDEAPLSPDRDDVRFGRRLSRHEVLSGRPGDTAFSAQRRLCLEKR